MLHIIIIPAYVEGKRLHGRFVATLAGRQLCTSREPLLAASRVLLAEGANPETPIAARHAGADFDAMMSTVGAAAGLTVAESNTRSATFAPYSPFPVQTSKQGCVLMSGRHRTPGSASNASVTGGRHADPPPRW